MGRECRYVIGIPTVRRDQGYLGRTVDSLIAAMPADDLARVRIVIFNGDVPASSNAEVAAVLRRHASLADYGTLTIESRQHTVAVETQDGEARWKRKQVIDCAALLDVCQGLSDYYLDLEDDIVAASGFIAGIDRRVREHQAAGRKWAILSFYNSFPIADGTYYSEFRLTRRYFGLIGQLVQARDLSSLAAYLRRHYTESAVDSLVGRWALVSGGAVIGHSPSLFQHVGVLSSYRNEIQIWESLQFPEQPKERRRRLRAALKEVKIHHPEAALDFLRYRRRLQAVRMKACC